MALAPIVILSTKRLVDLLLMSIFLRLTSTVVVVVVGVVVGVGDVVVEFRSTFSVDWPLDDVTARMTKAWNFVTEFLLKKLFPSGPGKASFGKFRVNVETGFERKLDPKPLIGVVSDDNFQLWHFVSYLPKWCSRWFSIIFEHFMTLNYFCPPPIVLAHLSLDHQHNFKSTYYVKKTEWIAVPLIGSLAVVRTV